MRHNRTMERGTRTSSVVVGAGVALILLLTMVVGGLIDGLLGMSVAALVSGVACGALFANDERKT